MTDFGDDKLGVLWLKGKDGVKFLMGVNDRHYKPWGKGKNITYPKIQIHNNTVIHFGINRGKEGETTGLLQISFNQLWMNDERILKKYNKYNNYKKYATLWRRSINLHKSTVYFHNFDIFMSLNVYIYIFVCSCLNIAINVTKKWLKHYLWEICHEWIMRMMLKDYKNYLKV